jgi:EAL domain-containing protein (putative c-di-GMP-specific phosphodiesterase class I)
MDASSATAIVIANNRYCPMNEMPAPVSIAPAPSQPTRTSLWLHLLTLLSITIVSLTAGVMLAHEFGFDPAAAIALGCGLFLVGSGLHLVVNTTTRNRLAPIKVRRSVVKNPKPTAPAPTSAEPALMHDAGMPSALSEVNDDIIHDEIAPANDDVSTTPTTALPKVEILPDQSIDPSQWADDLAAGLAHVVIRAPEPHLETEFERVERLVKRLADSVNQVEANRFNAQQPVSQQVAGVDPLQYSLFPPSNDSDQQLANSIHALRETTGLGPSGSKPPPILPDHRQGFTSSAQPTNALPAVDPKLSAPLPPPLTAQATPAHRNIQSGLELGVILDALAAHRIDVALEPILDLTAQRPEHYEVSIALRDRNAQLINLADIACDLSGTGALPLIDSARLVQAAQMARRLAEKGRRGTVLAELDAESLADQHFENTSRSEVGVFDGQIVLALAQNQASGFTNADWATLARLRSCGLAFALADVSTLDMDFTTLANAGFIFAKLDAQTFLSGLPIGTAVVPPADICRFLAEAGLTVIVQGIVASDQLAQVHACGVQLGQGQVFGGARQMKTSTAAPAQVAAE